MKTKTKKTKKTRITYASAGVNINSGNESVRRMKGYVRSTFNSNVLGDLGSFGGLFKFNAKGYKDPILVSSADGVGTKIMIAAEAKVYHTVGQDLVNHCVNDILVQGAKPLFFLDYFSTGVLEPKIVSEVVRGLSIACKQQDCVLIGGETAEMPGLYKKGDFDLAGTIVGAVERKDLITGETVKPGDVILGLRSSGLHTNGYSLARKVLFGHAKLPLKKKMAELDGRTLAEALLAPHRCYANLMLPLMKQVKIRALCHLTGGGFYDNIPRVLPKDCQAVIHKAGWEVPALFKLITTLGNVPTRDAYRTLNMGIGMIVIVRADEAPAAIKGLQKMGEEALVLGRVQRGNREAVLV
jgi:phosphoribosylformylglycinamidine cyclo-ligase